MIANKISAVRRTVRVAKQLRPYGVRTLYSRKRRKHERRKKPLSMINFKDEINRFKPSLEVGDIEKAIEKADLTDMSDIMMQLVKDASAKGGEFPMQRTNERL